MVLAPMRLLGLRVLNYLDNWLVCATSEEQWCSHEALLMLHVQAASLSQNLRKSKMKSFQVISFLSMTLHSDTWLP